MVSSKLLKTAGDTAGRTFLNFALTRCGLADGITKASVYFVAGDNINPAGRLSNTEQTGATRNVELQILGNDKAKTPMNLALGVGAQGATPVSITVQKDQSGADIAGTGEALIRHYVEYYATAQATAGGLKSDVEYEISYE